MMPRRARRTHPLGVLYFVVTAGLLVGGSVWLDRHGDTAAATVKQKREEITIQQEPRGGWERFYRVGVEFPTRDHNLGMATLDLPRECYDALRIGDTISVHYLPAFPLLPRAANRTTLQAVEDAGGRLLANRSLLPSVTWFLAGAGALWIASWVAMPVVVVTGFAWMGAGLLLLFPRVPPALPGPVTANARVAAINLITKAPAQTHSRRHRAGRAFGDATRRLAMPYQVVQLRLVAPGLPDSPLAVDAVDSGSVSGLRVGAEVPVRYDPRAPRDARLTVGTRTYLELNRYHFRTVVIGLALLGILAAWGARTRRSRRRATPDEGVTATPGRT